jgi:hypothetical protein
MAVERASIRKEGRCLFIQWVVFAIMRAIRRKIGILRIAMECWVPKSLS